MRIVTSIICLFVVTALHAEPPKPALEFRTRAISDSHEELEYALKLFMTNDQSEQILQGLKLVEAAPEGLFGIDTTRPLGGYIIVTQNVGDSPTMLLLPIKSETAFLTLIKNQKLTPKKGDNDIYTIDTGNIAVGNIFMRFANNYAYITIRSSEYLEKEKLVSPKEFFNAKQKEPISAQLHLDRFPKDIRKALLAQVELASKEFQENNNAGNEFEKDFKGVMHDIGIDIIKSLLSDGKTLSLNVSIKPKTDDISLALELTAQPGTPLQKTLEGLADRPSNAANVGMSKEGVASAINLKIPKETHDKIFGLLKHLDKAYDNADDGAKMFLGPIVEMVKATLKVPDQQWGVHLQRKDDKANKLAVAVNVVDGAKVDSVLREVQKNFMLPNIKLDVDSVGETKIHEIKTDPDDGLKLSRVNLAASNDAIVVADDIAEVKNYFNAKAKSTPMFYLNIAFVEFFGFTKENEKLPADVYKKVMTAPFPKGMMPGDDAVQLVVSGGKQLTIQLNAKGKAITLIRLLDEAKKAK